MSNSDKREINQLFNDMLRGKVGSTFTESGRERVIEVGGGIIRDMLRRPGRYASPRQRQEYIDKESPNGS